MKHTQRGITLIETLGALALGSMMLVGLTAMIDTAMEDTKGQQAALYQSQVVAATSKYLSRSDNYFLPSSAVVDTSPVTLKQLKDAHDLPDSFADKNVYGQTPCVMRQLRPTTTSKLDVLIVTSADPVANPYQIAEKDIAAVAANAGPGNGYIKGGVAQGASWGLSAAKLATFTSAGCASWSPPANFQLASALFFDSPGQLSTDFLYRNVIPGRPELNIMKAPLTVEGALTLKDSLLLAPATPDTACTTQGEVRSDTATGAVLSCQTGMWRKQTGTWKEPKPDFASLPGLGMGNQPGDVRMTLDKGLAFMWDGAKATWIEIGTWKSPSDHYAWLPMTNNQIGDVRLEKFNNRAYSWDGVKWVALAVDNLGNLNVPETMTAKVVELKLIANHNDPCTPDGTIARDATGQILSCKSGLWRDPQNFSLGNLAIAPQIYEFHGTDGLQVSLINLTAIPGPRPLYMSGIAICIASIPGVPAPPRTYVGVNWFDAGGRQLGWAGECGTSNVNGGTDYTVVKSSFGVQRIPDNAAYVEVHIEPGVTASDYAYAQVEIYNSN